MISDLKLVITETDLPYNESSFWKKFETGTCSGYFGEDSCCYDVFGISNKEPGNGHFNRFMELFEQMCVDNGKNLYVTHFENQNLKKHFVEKRGFEAVGNSVKKVFVK